MMPVTVSKKGSSNQTRQRIVQIVYGAAILCGLILGALIALEDFGATLPESYRKAFELVAFGCLVVSLAGTAFYWRALDELARRAHVEAWFWGGSLAMSAWMAVLVVSYIATGAMPFVSGESAERSFFLGAASMLLAGVLGYGVAWIYFWWSKR